MAATTILLGDSLGLYKAVADAGRVRAADLAKRLGLSERYVREWLSGQAAGGYIEYDAAADCFYRLPGMLASHWLPMEPA